MKLFFLLSLILSASAAITIAPVRELSADTQKRIDDLLNDAAALLKTEHSDVAKLNLLEALQLDPSSYDANQLYGTMLLREQPELSLEYFERALLSSHEKHPAIYGNYLEALRANNRHEEARKLGYELLTSKVVQISPSTCIFYSNLGLVERYLNNHQNAFDLLQTAVKCDKHLVSAWANLIELLLMAGLHADAEKTAKEGLELNPKDYFLYYLLGTAYHHQKKIHAALNAYLISESLNDKYLITKANIAAAFQGLGRSAEAISYYQKIIPLMPEDGGIRNNYGALLGTMNRKEEEIYWLEEALKLDPTMEHAMVNLAGHYQDEGMLEKAGHYLSMAENTTSGSRALLGLRHALMLTPVAFSYRQMLEERVKLINNLKALLHSPPKEKSELDTTLDRIHFYLSYHGFNDRYFQQGIGEIYHFHIKDINFTRPSLLLSSPLLSSPSSFYSNVQDYLRYEQRTQSELQALSVSSPPRKKSRIGFISKFFGIFEPHGMLLDGVMKYLPKDQFEIICLLVARTDMKPAAPTVLETCNEVYEISLVFQHAVQIISSVPLDVLVFADVVSEPINHFLAFNRLAPIQIAFWGNPITSGSNKIDYFMSADIMEHPFRTRMAVAQEPYTEQLVLLEGQGIWYFQPVEPAIELQKANISHLVGPIQNFTRKDFHLSENDFIFLLPQSVFKIHPLYDLVLSEILLRNSSVHLVVTGGRVSRWTKIYLLRLVTAIGQENAHRLHIIERVSSENFYSLLKISDVLLHPFPFDGSRTSADSLIVNIPFVTMPTEYLKGRMGYAFLRTMNISELVASTIEEYIDIALRLAADPEYYGQIQKKIATNLHLIWEDMHYPYQWTAFFQRLLGHSPYHSYYSFLKQIPTRNPMEELLKTKQRERNCLSFDETMLRTGKLENMRKWLLDEKGVAGLEFYSLEEDKWPRLFEYWHQNNRLKLFHSQSFEERMISKEFEDSLRNSNITLSDDLMNIIMKAPLKKMPTSSTEKENESQTGILKIEAELKITAPTAPSSSESPLVIGNNPAMEKIKKRTGNYLFDKNKDDENLPGFTSPSKLSVAPNTEHILQYNRYIELTNEFYDLFNQRKLSEAIATGKDLLMFLESTKDKKEHPLTVKGHYEKEYPLLLFEIGLLFYFSGNYIPSFNYCSQANQFIVQNSETSFYRQSSLLFACLGMNNLYLPFNLTVVDPQTGAVSEQLINEKIGYLESSYELMEIETQEKQQKNILQQRKPRLTTQLFSLTKISIENSLIQLYQHFQQYSLCSTFLEKYYSMPPMEYETSYVIVFSLMKWNESYSKSYLDNLEEILLQNQLFYSHPVMNSTRKYQSLYSQIRHFQTELEHLVNPLMTCFMKNPKTLPMLQQVQNNLYAIITQINLSQTRATAKAAAAGVEKPKTSSNDKESKRGLALVTQYYVNKNDPTIQQDLNIALTKNLQNPFIDEVYLLTEEEITNFESFPNHFKIKQYVVGKRLTFQEAFQFANNYLQDRIVVLGNFSLFYFSFPI
jgi:protein O-GlcNAc transferase